MLWELEWWAQMKRMMTVATGKEVDGSDDHPAGLAWSPVGVRHKSFFVVCGVERINEETA